MCKCAENSSQHQIIGVKLPVTDENRRSETLEILQQIKIKSWNRNRKSFQKINMEKFGEIMLLDTKI